MNIEPSELPTDVEESFELLVEGQQTAPGMRPW